MYIHDAHLANVVTSFSTLCSGFIVSFFWYIDGKQPFRWLFFYLTIIVTAIPTIIHHMYPTNIFWTSVDIITNILLIWAVELALAGDFLKGKNYNIFVSFVTGINSGVILYLTLTIFYAPAMKFLSINGQHGFTPGEIALILNAVLVVILMALYSRSFSSEQKKVVILLVWIFLLGLILATGNDSYIYPQFISWHSLWHIVGSFGFVVFWYFNHLRFSTKGESNYANS